MLLTIIVIVLLFWVYLGWCWSEALMRLDAHTQHSERNYHLACVFWPFSMMLWDAEQQELEDDN